MFKKIAEFFMIVKALLAVVDEIREIVEFLDDIRDENRQQVIDLKEAVRELRERL